MAREQRFQFKDVCIAISKSDPIHCSQVQAIGNAENVTRLIRIRLMELLGDLFLLRSRERFRLAANKAIRKWLLYSL